MGDSSKKPTSSLFKVNLLIHKGDQPKLYTRLLKWLLSSGRYIVIVVELITIGAFIFRYKLDGDLADLHDQIKQKPPYIQSLKNEEIIIRETQFQLTTIKQIKVDSPDFATIFAKIALLTPKNIKLTNISLERTQTFPKTSLIITGSTPSSSELSAFLRSLQKDPTFTEITLTNISFEETTNFTLTGSLSDKGDKKS